MFRNRRRNWLIRRIALGFAFAAFAAPVAQAKVDEGSSVQASGYKAFVTDFPSSPAVIWKDPGIVATDLGIPRALPSDSVQLRGGKLEFIRSVPDWTSPKLVGRFGSPNVTRGPEVAVASNVNWDDAAIGAGFALALVLLGGAGVLATRHMHREQTA